MRLYALVTILLLAGCASRRPAFFVEMNGRQVEFESFRDGKVPRGDEVSHFDLRGIRVAGEEPIEVNGMSILADGKDLVIGGQKLSVHRDARIFVRNDGEIEVRLSLDMPVRNEEPVLETTP